MDQDYQNDEKFIAIQQVSKWHEFHKRSRSPLFSEFFLGSTGIRKANFPFDNRIRHLGTFLDHVAVDLSEKKRIKEKTIGFLEKKPDFLLELMDCGQKEHKEKLSQWQKSELRDFLILSNTDLANAFCKYINDINSFGIYVTLPLFIEDYLETFIKDGFEKRFGSEAREWFSVATDPLRDGTITREKEALLQMVVSGKMNLEKHRHSFCWMKNVGFFEDYYGLDYYRDRLKQLKSFDTEKELQKIEIDRTNRKKKFDQLLRLISDDPYLTSLVKTTNEAVFFRSYRTEMYYSSPFYNHNLLSEVSHRLGLSRHDDYVWLYSMEISNFLINKEVADQKLIEARKTGCCFLSDFDGKNNHWDGPEAKIAFDFYQESRTEESAQAGLTGHGSFPGIVEGDVVVVRNESDLGKVKNGDIIVTHSTNINFVAYLRKVSAIITEEGGILSHASVISRELEIPCIVGTRIATKILKDGDKVLVNADTGIVTTLQD